MILLDFCKRMLYFATDDVYCVCVCVVNIIVEFIIFSGQFMYPLVCNLDGSLKRE
jgi:hypothetical protein